MPFNNPQHRDRDSRGGTGGDNSKRTSASTSRQPSPPHRNPSTSSTTSTATASSTSSLEAVTIKPPPIQTRTAASGLAQLPNEAELQAQLQALEANGNSTVRVRPGRNVPQLRPVSGYSSHSHSRTRQGSTGAGGAQETSVSPTTPRQSQSRFPAVLPGDFPPHLLANELRSSSSGPDLSSLRARAKEERRNSQHGSIQESIGGSSGGSPVGPPNGQGQMASTLGLAGTGIGGGSADSIGNTNVPLSAPSNVTVHGTSAGSSSSGFMVTSRPKMRTRSSSAQVTQLVTHSQPGTARMVEVRRAVTLLDFTFGEVLGKGSYSTVVLAQQKATQIPYAIKILDQHHLVQEKKTKYAKVERDALVSLGPRITQSSSSYSNGRRGSASGGSSSSRSYPGETQSYQGPVTPGKRRQSTSESINSVDGVIIGGGKGKKKEGTRLSGTPVGAGGVDWPSTISATHSAPGHKRRTESMDSTKRASRVISDVSSVGSVSPTGTTGVGLGIPMSHTGSGINGSIGVDGSLTGVVVTRRPSDVEEDDAEALSHSPTSEHPQPHSSQPQPILTNTAPSDDSHGDHTSTAAQRLQMSSLPSSNSVASNLTTRTLKESQKVDDSALLGVPKKGKGPNREGQERGRDSLDGDSRQRTRGRSSHPGVIRLHYTFKDETSLYFVLDLAINGELLGIIKNYGSLDLHSATIYAAQLLDTISFMHERGVIHRDIKPENILLDDDMRMKMSDFGSAKLFDPEKKQNQSPATNEESERKRSFVGTAEYVSPEVLRNEAASTASDVWAFGCVLYQMIAGRPCFRAATEYLTFQKVLHAEYDFPEEFDESVKDLIQSTLKLDPEDRPTIEQLQLHPMFDSINFDTIWTDQMPELRSGIRGPSAVSNVPVDLAGWDEVLDDGNDGISDDEMDPFVHDNKTTASESPNPNMDLEAPRQRWIQNGGGAGTFSSGSGGTDDNVSLVGARLRPDLQGVFTRNSEEAESLERQNTTIPLGRRRSSVQWALNDKKEVWAHHLLPNERIVYSSPILTRSGLFLPKRRTLVLTDFPRLICVKEDAVKGRITVKAECIFNVNPTAPSTHSLFAPPSPNSENGSGSLSTLPAAVVPRCVTMVEKKGPRSFIVKTHEKDHTFIADREDIRERWIQEIGNLDHA